jgi:O-antigen ligase
MQPAMTADSTAQWGGGPASVPLALLFALTLVGFQFASTLPELFGVDSQVVSVPFRLLVLGLTGLVMFGWLVRGTRLCGGVTVYLTLALWVLLIGRMLYDTVIDPLAGEPGMKVSRYLQLSLFAGFVPALAFLELPSRATLERARRYTELLGATALAMLIYLGLQGFFEGQIFRRLSTEVLNPISVGHLGVTVFVVALAGLHGSRGIARVLRQLLIAASLFAVVASVSRGPILAALVLALVHVFAGQMRRGLSLAGLIGRLALIAGGIALFVLLILYLEDNAKVQVAARFAGTFADASARERFLLFGGAWQQFASSPFLGDAYVELRLMTYPHNLLLETLMATGIVGFALLLLVLLGAALAGARAVAAGPALEWPVLLLMQFTIALMFSGSILLEGRFWALLFAVLAIDAARRAGQSSGAPRRDAVRLPAVGALRGGPA